MIEAHMREVENVLLYVSEARQRAARARRALETGGAEPHLVAAVADAESSMTEEHRRLMQATYFAVPADQQKLSA